MPVAVGWVANRLRRAGKAVPPPEEPVVAPERKVA
jgi:hypothetical protein